MTSRCALFTNPRTFPQIQRRYFSEWPVYAKVASLMIGLPASLYTYKITLTVLLQNKIIYSGYYPPGSRNVKAHPEKYQLQESFNQVFLKTRDGKRLETWTFRALRSDPCTVPTLLYFQGNAGNLGHRLRHIRLLLDTLDVNLVAVHYRGYGRSNGHSSEKGLQIDAETVFDYVSTTSPWKTNGKFMLFGHSLGGAVATYLAFKHGDKFQAMILENTFASVKDMVPAVYPKWTIYPYLTSLLWNHWPSIERISNIKCPILFIAGADDEIVPPEQMKLLHDSAKSARYRHLDLIPGGLHDTTWMSTGYRETLVRFMQRVND